MHWIELTESSQIAKIKSDSFQKIALVFKNSLTCSISQVVKMSLEDGWDESLPVNAYLVHVQTGRNISNQLASEFDVYHESPQILMIKDGVCIHDASHFDITVKEVAEVLDYHGAN